MRDTGENAQANPEYPAANPENTMASYEQNRRVIESLLDELVSVASHTHTHTHYWPTSMPTTTALLSEDYAFGLLQLLLSCWLRSIALYTAYNICHMRS